MKRYSKWSRSEKWTAAGVLAAVTAAVVALLTPEVRKKLGLDRGESSIQQVNWGPDQGYPPGILILKPKKEFIPWNQLDYEMSSRVIRNIYQLPAGSSLNVAESGGVSNLVVEVRGPKHDVLAHVWFGGNPMRGFAWDGRIRIGTPSRPVVVYATYERHTDGTYIRVEDAP